MVGLKAVVSKFFLWSMIPYHVHGSDDVVQNDRISLQCRHNESDGVSNHRRLRCLLNCCFRRRSKKTTKLRVTCLCAGNSPVTGEFPARKASNAENVPIWWRHHVTALKCQHLHIQPNFENRKILKNSKAIQSFMLYCYLEYIIDILIQWSFGVCAQPMRDDVTM